MGKEKKPKTVRDATADSSNRDIYNFEANKSIAQNIQRQKTLGKKLRAYVEGSWEKKTSSSRNVETNRFSRLARFTGNEGLANFVELFILDAEKAKAKREAKEAKRKDTEEKPSARGGDSGVSRRTSARMLGVLRDVRRDTMVTRAVVTSMGGELSDVGRAVNDIKSLIMPKNFNVRVGGRKQGVSFNPLAPQGNQLRLVENGEISNIAPGSRIKEKAIQKAAWIGATTAFKIERKDRERTERRKKHAYRDPKEAMRMGDPVLAFLGKIDKRLDRIEDLLEDGVGKKGGGVGTAAGAAGALAARAATAIPGVLATIAANIKPLGIASIPLAALYYAQDQAGAAVAYVEGGGDIDSYKGYNPFILGAQRGRKKDKWWYPKEWEDKREAGYKAREQKNAAAGRTRGGVASSKGMALDDTIAHYKKMSEDPKLPQAQREAYKRIYDTLVAQRGPLLDARNARITGGLVGGGTVIPKPAAPSSELVSDIERDSDTWDTNYATPTAPRAGKKRRGGVGMGAQGGTGTLLASTYESRLDALGNVIAKGESGGDYNVFNKGKGHGYKKGREDLSKMTIAEYMRRGTLPSKHPDKMFATGKYQIIPDTMQQAIDKLGLNPNTTLSPDTQEYIFREFLTKSKRPAINQYLTGKSSDMNAALVAVAQEWASVGVPTDMQGAHRWVKKGESYYADDGINKSHTTPEAVLSAITPVSRPDGSLLAGAPYGATPNGGVGSLSISPISIQTNTQNNTVAQRPAQKASAVSNDQSLVRIASRDTKHPVYAG